MRGQRFGHRWEILWRPGWLKPQPRYKTSTELEPVERRTMKRKRPNRELKNQYHPGLSIHPKPLTGDQLLERGAVVITDPETVNARVQEFMATERILNRQQRNRTMGRRIAWAVFWAIIVATVWVCSQALGGTLERIITALENL